jgi:hypothetical protein
LVVKFSTGRAKNARKASEWPSTTRRVGFEESVTLSAYPRLPTALLPEGGHEHAASGER